MDIALRTGEDDQALALANQLAAKVPGSSPAHSVIVQVLQRRDPEQAIAHVAGLLQEATGDASRDTLEAWLALLEDGAGHAAQAVARWESLGARRIPSMLPLPPASPPPGRPPGSRRGCAARRLLGGSGVGLGWAGDYPRVTGVHTGV